MIRKVKVKTFLLVVIGIICVLQNAHAQIKVGANVQVSKANGSLAHDEVLGASDPKHPERLMVGSILTPVDRRSEATAAYASFDGGKSWSQVVQKRGEADDVICDPICAYGPDGSAYFGSVSDDGNTYIFRSPDGGKNWLSPVTLYGAIDRPYIVVDGTGGPYNGRIYVNHMSSVNGFDEGKALSLGADMARGVVTMGLSRSLDGGRTFLGPVMRAGLAIDGHLGSNPSNSVVLSDGTLVSLFFESKQIPDPNEYVQAGRLRITRSMDGGESYSDAVTIADRLISSSSMVSIPNIAVDPGSSLFKDRMYVVWQDGRVNLQQCMISYSSDKGKTWSRPRRFSDSWPTSAAPGGPSEFQATVAVNKDGVVGVMWYDRRDNPNGGGYWVRFTASLDGGETWMPSVRISEAPNTLGGAERWVMVQQVGNATQGAPITVGMGRRVWESSGHTAGLTADANGVFHHFWIDNRTGVPQVWTAPISISGEVVKNGATEVADWDDLSEKVKVEVSGIAFDKAGNTLSADVQLKNISKETVVGPLKMRIVSLGSQLGRPEILGAENGRKDAGAIIDLSSVLNGGSLKPGEISEGKHLSFQVFDLVSELGTFCFNGKVRWDMINFEARIFGKAHP